jgi:multiple sugar transport system ATP-binding protein
VAEIRIDRVTKTFKQVRAVDDVQLTVADGEFVALLGPSGCGKTTLLRSIAGLEEIDSGRIVIGDRDVTNLPPRHRRIAMVFQSYAVFPHMTVFENIAFGLRMAKLRNEEVKRRVDSAAELLHITELLARYPAQTSGGQRQRIAVARAIAMQSGVILMDEPLSNLDALLRLEMRAELKRLLKEVGTTTIYVTHDQVEALSMGDRIAVMRAGQIVQVGDPLSIYDAPVDRFVGGFIGNPPMNFLAANLEAENGGLVAVVEGGGRVSIAEPAPELVQRAGRPVVVGIRAENIEVRHGEGGAGGGGGGAGGGGGGAGGAGAVAAQVLVVEPLGSHNLVTLALGEGRVKATTRPDDTLVADQQVTLVIDARRIRWLDAETGQAIGPEPQPHASATPG